MNPTNSSTYDLVIVGGGAAGLMACASAIRAGKKVLLLEKNNKLGVKILMSGGTRCNITQHCDSRGIVNAFGSNGKFLHSALATLGPEDVVAHIESAGVKTKVESTGKIFPVSNRAIDVRDALVQLATAPDCSGTAKIISGVACRNIRKSGDQFLTETEQDSFSSTAVLITTGGKSYPKCGTNGDGYRWARSFGHTIRLPVPALTPLTNGDCWSHQLKGITLEDVAIRIATTSPATTSPQTQVLDQRRGGFLFTHFGFSGPAALNISRSVSLLDEIESVTLQCDYFPDWNEDKMRLGLTEFFQRNPKQSVGNALTTYFPRRFVELALLNHEFAFDIKSGEIGKKAIRRLISMFKAMTFPVHGVYGFAKAEVTAGGVSLNEIDSRTMESKLCPGLYFAGEVIDLDGPIGGYNFQAAFSTGWLAALQSRI